MEGHHQAAGLAVTEGHTLAGDIETILDQRGHFAGEAGSLQRREYYGFIAAAEANALCFKIGSNLGSDHVRAHETGRRCSRY